MTAVNMGLGGLGLVFCATTGYMIWRKGSSPYPLPPSPTYYPLIGNLLSVPTQEEHVGFLRIGKELKSNIFSLRVFGTTIIVLNSLEDAVNLLEKRSSIYSDRVSLPMVGDPTLMDWGRALSNLGYNDRWKKSRRLIHPWLHKQAAEAFWPSQQLQARMLLQRLLQASNDLSTSHELDIEFFRTVAGTITHSVYGYNVQSSDDSFVLGMKIAADNGTKAALPSNFLVNLFPSLLYVPEWFPGAGWKRLGREWRVQKEAAIDKPFEWTKAQIAAGENEPSIIASLLANDERLGLTEQETDEYVKEIAATLFAGGTDSTSNTILVFVLAMLLYPDIQTKAQRAIDDVVGSDRLPTMEDKPQLEYVERLMYEVLRWRPIVPNGIPHVCFQDDAYKGYRIPKGSIVVGNIWAITRNEAVYEDPETLDPDRYLDTNVPYPPIFGFGRRLCPGLHYAEASIFIMIASILATFDIKRARDANGNEIIPVIESANNLIYHPKPFDVKLVPRSKLHADLVRMSA